MKLQNAFVIVALFVSAAAHAADAPPQMSAEQKAMMDKMTKAATPGAPHAMLAKMAGEWTCTVEYQMDPSQPAQKSQSSATITSMMDGRYIQEVASGQMMGMPFSGMGLYGFDNVIGKYVSTWIDNMGTGIMTSVGTADASGKLIAESKEVDSHGNVQLSVSGAREPLPSSFMRWNIGVSLSLSRM